MRVRTQCRQCGLPFKAVLIAKMPALACPGCGCRHLYRQRDFNRALGCGLVLLGAALVPWTFGLSLIACGLIDLWLYRRLRDAVVCYQCDTVYRDARPLPRQGEFELLKHDVLKYGKAWEPKTGPSAGMGEKM